MLLLNNVHHYDNNCLVFIDREWSTSKVAALRAQFADGPFELNYYGTDTEFTKRFKESFKSFYEKVLRDYDEALGYDKPTYEDCFDAMVADMTLIGRKPERTVDINFEMPTLNRLLKETHEVTTTMVEVSAGDIVTLKDIFNELYKEEK